ncbi:MAG: DUF424 family protein [Methanolobus sp.]
MRFPPAEKAANVNIFGEKAVSCAVKCGVSKQGIMLKIIDEVAHAQIFRI